MFFALIFWRVIVFIRGDSVSFLREISGLNIHHFHYGIFFILISCLIFIFHKPEKYSIALAGFGFGSFFDGFISRLLTNSSRELEILNYNQYFYQSIFLFIVIILFVVDFHLIQYFKKDL